VQVKETSRYTSSLKKFKRDKLLLQKIEKTIQTFIDDETHASINYKKINCKKDKDKYSIRVIGTQYRILMTVLENTAYFQCVCSHDRYDATIKDC